MAEECTRQARLNWEASFEIAKRLEQEHPTEKLEEVSLKDLVDWTVALPDFADDPELANDDVLSAIYQEWYEEKDPL